jgi:glycerol-3-phosphate acyltransferase PlsY
LAGAICAVAVAMLRERPIEYRILTALLFVLVLYTHRANIQRLLKKTERSV